MKLVKAVPMPPYFYQEPEWMKPRRHKLICSASSADVEEEATKAKRP